MLQGERLILENTKTLLQKKTELAHGTSAEGFCVIICLCVARVRQITQKPSGELCRGCGHKRGDEKEVISLGRMMR